MIHVRNLKVVYCNPTTEAVRDVSFSLKDGESCSIIGPSGCGKTTLLHILAGLIKPTSGDVTVEGESPSGRRGTALILQAYGLLPWKDVWGNASLGLTIRGYPRGKRNEIVEAILRRLDIYDLKRKYPSQLSGGERQRVAIARALSFDPDLILMDEPFSSLDELTREGLQELFLSIWRERNATFCLVTHDIEEAVYLGRSVMVLSPQPARVVEIIDNPCMGHEGYRYSEEFFNRCNYIRKVIGSLNGTRDF